MPSDKRNLIMAKATTDLIFFAARQGFSQSRCLLTYHITWTFQCHPLYFIHLGKSVDFVVALDGFLCVTEIIHTFHSGYFNFLDLYCCVAG